jgi:hypothetical protein
LRELIQQCGIHLVCRELPVLWCLLCERMHELPVRVGIENQV